MLEGISAIRLRIPTKCHELSGSIARWGERFSHPINPDGQELNFARPLLQGSVRSQLEAARHSKRCWERVW
jgi:hypothetical protein